MSGQVSWMRAADTSMSLWSILVKFLTWCCTRSSSRNRSIIGLQEAQTTGLRHSCPLAHIRCWLIMTADQMLSKSLQGSLRVQPLGHYCSSCISTTLKEYLTQPLDYFQMIVIYTPQRCSYPTKRHILPSRMGWWNSKNHQENQHSNQLFLGHVYPFLTFIWNRNRSSKLHTPGRNYIWPISGNHFRQQIII